MHPHLSYVVAPSRQQNMLRRAQHAQTAAQSMTGRRRLRFRLTLPRPRVATRPAPPYDRAVPRLRPKHVGDGTR
jgi:hypothetical protein